MCILHSPLGRSYLNVNNEPFANRNAKYVEPYSWISLLEIKLTH